jgi:uncharacterized protein (DUF2267 family)
MDGDEFLERVMVRAGFETRTQAETATQATLAALAAALAPEERERVAGALPKGLRSLLHSEDAVPDMSLTMFLERVQRSEGTRTGFAVEHAQAVCSALLDTASEELEVLLRRHLVHLAALFRTRESPMEPDPDPERVGHVVTHDRTLAGGRPGSRHPVSEARPDRSHGHSVASNDDPHADSKLSSSRGLTQEREGESLAAGRPPRPDRPLSGG